MLDRQEIRGARNREAHHYASKAHDNATRYLHFIEQMCQISSEKIPVYEPNFWGRRAESVRHNDRAFAVGFV
jgi:hypothetical protein